MRVRFRTARTVVALASVMLLAAILSGCNNGDDKGKNPTPPPVVTQKPTERVELMPDKSDEYLRRHFIDASGFEVETRIEYRNGDKATIKFRSDKTQESYKRVTKAGTVLSEQNYAADGKTIVSGQELRPDGTLKWKATQDSSGSVKTVTYWWDGTTMFSEKTTQLPSGAYETAYYRKDGQLWMKRSGPDASVVATEMQYNKDGKLDYTRQRKGSDVIVTLHRPDGTAQFRQYMTETQSPYGSYTYKTMVYVEELAADGTTVVRRLTMSGYSVNQVTRYNSDGTTLVRDIQYDGTVTHEEKRDSSGKVLSQKDYSASDGVKETYDWRAVRDPYFDDPVSTWDMAERYPYYRK